MTSFCDLADFVALDYPDIYNYECIRDVCDQASHGELNSFALDMLTDMTQKRLIKNRESIKA